MIFLTEHRESYVVDTPNIEANSWDEAEMICPKHLKIIGELLEEIEFNGFDLINMN
jgi:hypothetical protein